MWTRFISVTHVLSEQPEPVKNTLYLNLHFPERQLIELKIEHADLNALVDTTAHTTPMDEVMLRRLKKQRLILRDQIARLELSLDPPAPA